MASQTKIGFVTLILLVGCIFAIPHFRHPLSAEATPEESEQATETDTPLKLKLDPVREAQKRLLAITSVPASRGLREQKTGEQRSVLVSPEPNASVSSVQREQWKFPPIRRKPAAHPTAQPDATEPQYADAAPGLENDLSMERPRPVRLPPEAIAPVPFADPAEDFARTEPRTAAAEPPARRRQLSPDVNDSERHDRPRRETVNVARSHLVERRDVRSFDSEPALHRIVNGDTLENLALQYYGDPRKAMLIFESNRDALLNPAILPLGVDLKIPNAE